MRAESLRYNMHGRDGRGTRQGEHEVRRYFSMGLPAFSQALRPPWRLVRSLKSSLVIFSQARTLRTPGGAVDEVGLGFVEVGDFFFEVGGVDVDIECAGDVAGFEFFGG